MDRRKIQSKSTLQNRLHSSSQLTLKTTAASTKNNIIRSASVDNSKAFSRKRKNSSDEDKNLSQASLPVTVNTRKKRRNQVLDSDEDKTDDEVMNTMRLRTKLNNKKEHQGRLSKLGESEEFNSIKKTSNNSDKDEENDQNNTTGGSYIKGVLEALDKSPTKLSQSSSSSINKFHKLNLRTPIRSKLQQSASKTIGGRHKEIDKHTKSDESIDDQETEKFDISKLVDSITKKKNEYNESDNSIEQSEQEELDYDGNNSINKIISQSNKSTSKLPNTSTKSKRYDKTCISPITNLKNKTRIKSLNISPFKNDENVEKNIMTNVNTRRKKTSIEINDKLTDFLTTAGITLFAGDNLHVANDDPREVIQKMKTLLSLNSFDVDEIIQSWNQYIDDEENLTKSLLEIKIETDEGVGLSSKALSLSRFLLQVPELQVQVFQSLFKRLIDAVITSDSSDDVPWAIQMLQQFRFLEIIVNSELLITQIEELLSSSPEWFQCEVIVFIPDIVMDTHHHETAEMLIKIMKNNKDLTNIILDCIQNLILSRNYKEELREQILSLLETDVDKSILPAITRFILDSCPTEAIALKSLNAIRLLNITTTVKKDIEECYTNQMFIMNAIKMNIHLFKEVTQAALTIIKTCFSEPVPLDIIIIILLYETTTVKKKLIETTLFSHIKDGYYKTSLLNRFYTDYKEVAKSFQSTALNLAISLLKTTNSVHIEFSVEWLRNIFISQSDTSYKQREILERLLNLMGNKDQTVKNALEVLSRIANNEVECKYFQQHAAFLRCFVEKIDNLQFHEVSILYHILHGLCTQSELISNILDDDLSIIMQKQLQSTKLLTKCKGVLGAVMAIKHLAKNNETSDQAFELLKKTFNGLKNCLKSQALFYDQLGQIISCDDIDDQFLSDVTNFFEDCFVSSCLVETLPNNNLVPKFGLNDPGMAESYYVNFGNGITGGFVPAFFKLLCICNLRLSGSLESINAVLGCSILMPEDLDMPEPSTADYMLHCINWFREIIGGFVTQKEVLLREQVIQRLQSLMTLQGEFVTLISMCGSFYQPPPCYFHHFPTPQFVRMDTKLGKKRNKKGKKKNKKKNKEEDKEEDKQEDKTDSTLNKSVLLPEWKNWVIGSELTIKNPAFFRKMDTKIINLLDTQMNIQSQTPSDKITIAQVCFIIKELLGLFENQTSERFIQDLIKLLPKICTKFQKIISDLRECENVHEKEAVRLILCLFTTIFMWKEFKNPKHNILLRDGLRTLASMMDESNALLRSCKDLVAEVYKYFESLADIATEISIAVALVNICNCMMKQSTSFMEQTKLRQAKMAFGFLCLEWNNETHGPQYKTAIKDLLKMWLDNEPDPLETVNSILEWLPEEAKSFTGSKSRLDRLSSINKINFHLLVKQLFVGLINGVELSLNLAETDPERIRIWLQVAICLEKLSEICKLNKNNIYLVLFIRYTAILYQILLTSGMKILEMNVKYQTEEVLNVIKLFQKSGRFLRDIFCTARKDKNVSLLKLIPVAKSRREKFIYRVKGMLTANNSIGAFWMGNLLNKDLDGEEIVSESSEDITIGSELTTENNISNDMESEIFNSDSDEDSEDDE